MPNTCSRTCSCSRGRLRAAGVARARRRRARCRPGARRRRRHAQIRRPRRAARGADLPARGSRERSTQLFERFWRVWPDERERHLPRPMHVPPRVATDGAHAGAAEAGVGASEPRRVPRRRTPVARADLQSQTTCGGGRTSRRLRRTIWRAPRRRWPRLAWTPGVRRHAAMECRTRSARSICAGCCGRTSKHGGELVDHSARVRRVAPRPLILICDVSGSMEPYTRMLLLFAHAHRRRRAARRGVRLLHAAHAGDAAVRGGAGMDAALGARPRRRRRLVGRHADRGRHAHVQRPVGAARAAATPGRAAHLRRLGPRRAGAARARDRAAAAQRVPARSG